MLHNNYEIKTIGNIRQVNYLSTLEGNLIINYKINPDLTIKYNFDE